MNFKKSTQKRRFFAIYAWSFLAFNIYTILSGAFVRATGSGAGCGDHWPLCNGRLLPNLTFFHTIIEFTHRISSGVVTAGVLILLLGAFLVAPKRDLVRVSAMYALVFVVCEALLGAGLVLFHLVDENSSLLRAIVMSCHLFLTFALLASLSLCAAWASSFPQPRFLRDRKRLFLVGCLLLGFCLIGVSGALTALGDLFFKPHHIGENWIQEMTSADHFLKSLRAYHPIISVVVGFFALFFMWKETKESSQPLQRGLCWLVTFLILIQFCCGFLNIYLGVPIWLQILHLFNADLVWVGVVLFSNMVLSSSHSHS